MVRTSILLTLAASVSVSSADLGSVFSKLLSLEQEMESTASTVINAGRDLAGSVNIAGDDFSPYDESQTLGSVCGEDVAGTYGLEWETSGSGLSLASTCVPDSEVCEDLSKVGCERFYKKGKALMTILGWDGHTTLQSIWDQVKDQAEKEDKFEITENTDGSTSIEGYNLSLYRIGDVCPVSAKMCDEEFTAIFPVTSAESLDAVKAKLRRQACVATSNFWVPGSVGGSASPDLANCRFYSPVDGDEGGRKLAELQVAVAGSLTSMNALLSLMVEENSVISQLAFDPTSGFDIITPTATYTTDKKTNTGTGLNMMQLAIAVLAIFLCIFCCCCFCCCRYVCKCCCTPTPKSTHNDSDMQMTAVIN